MSHVSHYEHCRHLSAKERLPIFLLQIFMSFRRKKIGMLMGKCAMSCPDGDRYHPGSRDEGNHNVVVTGDHRGGLDLRVRVLVRMVMGATRVAHSQRDFPAGDEVGRAKYHSVHQPVLHVPHRPGVPVDVVHLQVGHLPLLRRLGGRHADVRLLLRAGDKGRPH